MRGEGAVAVQLHCLGAVSHEVIRVVRHVDVGLGVVGLLHAGHQALLPALTPPAAHPRQQQQSGRRHLELTELINMKLLLLHISWLTFYILLT